MSKKQGCIIGLIKFLIQPKEKKYPFQKCNILSPAELNFYKTIKHYLQKDYEIFCKVRLEDIIKVKGKMTRAEYQTQRNRIKSRHIDFIICDPKNLNTLMALELDDKSHRTNQRQIESDKFINKALEKAEIPLKRVTCKKSYSETDIQEIFS